MKQSISRRDFLRLGLLSLGTLAAGNLPPQRSLQVPNDHMRNPYALGRVAADYVNIYTEASFKSERLGRYKKDTIIPLLARVHTTLGWKNRNPNWYRTPEGFIHSAFIQCFENSYNQPVKSIPEDGQLGEITVAYAQGFRYIRYQGWEPFYRAYYQTVHWVTDIVEGPNKEPWYEITDERLRVRYIVPATCVRLVRASELAPIAPDVHPDDKYIQVSIGKQKLLAFEGDKLVFQAAVSTGIHTEGPTLNGIPTDTPLGRFYIGNKMPTRHMGNGTTDSNIYAYELPGVPWNMFFVSTGVAFHGAYWHDNFGYPMSAGCVNLKPEVSKWLYRWTTPALEPGEWHRYERGTRVDVV